MFFEAFNYGFDWERTLDFIEWWIKSGEFTKDIKKGDKVKRGTSIRDIDHTIQVVRKDKFELLILKSIISSDGPTRSLEFGESYLNKGIFGTGYDKSIKKIRKWLIEMDNYDPYKMNYPVAEILGMQFNLIGTGLFIQNYQESEWKLQIIADVVGIPK